MPKVIRDPSEPIPPLETSLPLLEAEVDKHLLGHPSKIEWSIRDDNLIHASRALGYTGALGAGVITVSKGQETISGGHQADLPAVYRLEAAAETLRWTAGTTQPDDITFGAADVEFVPGMSAERKPSPEQLTVLVAEFLTAMQTARPLD